jgi:hypothetical protein
MQLDELYLRLPPGKEGEVFCCGHTLLKHCLLLSSRHTIVDWTYPRPFREKKNKCQLNRRNGTERTKPKHLEQRTGGWGHWRPQSVLLLIPGAFIRRATSQMIPQQDFPLG